MQKILRYLLVSAIISVPVFFCLDKSPIRLWDESRLAINAYEMSVNNDFIVTTFSGEPDMWNTKPPLLIWIQALLLKLLGITPLAIRIPAAFAGYLTCILLFSLLGRVLRNYLFGFIAVLVLITSQGYIENHVVRTGDYDAMLVLFMTAYSWAFWYYCETRRTKFLYFFYIIAAMAALTKGVAGIMFFPALLMYAGIQKRVPELLKNKHFYFGLLVFCLPVIGYYLLRENYNPGYIRQVLVNEVGGRYFETIEDHHYPFFYYFDYLRDSKYRYWLPICILGCISVLSLKSNPLKKIGSFTIIIILTYFLIISSSRTKLSWYDAPMYPFLAILTALPIYLILEKVRGYYSQKGLSIYKIIPYALIALLFALPYYQVVAKIYDAEEYPGEEDVYETSEFIRNGIHHPSELDGRYLVSEGYNPHVRFYMLMARDKNIHFKAKSINEIKKGDELIVQQETLRKYVQANFNYKVLNVIGNIVVYRIM